MALLVRMALPLLLHLIHAVCSLCVAAPACLQAGGAVLSLAPWYTAPARTFPHLPDINLHSSRLYSACACSDMPDKAQPQGREWQVVLWRLSKH